MNDYYVPTDIDLMRKAQSYESFLQPYEEIAGKLAEIQEKVELLTEEDEDARDFQSAVLAYIIMSNGSASEEELAEHFLHDTSPAAIEMIWQTCCILQDDNLI